MRLLDQSNERAVYLNIYLDLAITVSYNSRAE